jgi:hypothetical protein
MLLSIYSLTGCIRWGKYEYLGYGSWYSDAKWGYYTVHCEIISHVPPMYLALEPG